MDIDRELHRFPRGETCTECPARRWYSESGFRYCQNGHRVEGFVEFDVDQDDNFGKAGRVARKQKDVKQRERKHLPGNQARELYLECLQLILRKQISWLVKERGLPLELEGVVRDLWDLRVRGFKGLSDAALLDRRRREGRGTKSETQSESDGELALFSSQSDSEAAPSDNTSSGTTTRRRWRGVRNWASEDGERWAMPGLLDTLALVYLGCLTIRQPVRIGELHRWAARKKIPYLRAIDEIPKEMRDRLLAPYQKALWPRHAALDGEQLHRAAMDLALSYQQNYNLSFPPLATPTIYLQYLRELAVPLEIYPYAKKVVSLLRTQFTMPTGSRPPLNNPETLLVASIVLVSKLLYPFDGTRVPRGSDNDAPCLRIDWEGWQKTSSGQGPLSPPGRGFDSLTSADVPSMDGEKMDEYLEWYEQSRLPPQEDTRNIERLFPLGGLITQGRVREEDDGDASSDEEDGIQKRLHEAQSSIAWVQPHAASNERGGPTGGLGVMHQRYETVEELSGPALAFHEKAATLSGLSTTVLLRAVFRLEQLLLYWTGLEREGGTERVAEGAESRQLARFLGIKEVSV